MIRNQRFALTLLAAAGLGAAVYRLEAPSHGGSEPRIGSPAPEHRWTDLSGQSASLSHYRGRVVLLDFWATWCESCQEEQPGLRKLYDGYHGRGLEILAPSVDEAGRKTLIPYLASHPVPWKVLIPDQGGIEAFRVFGLPTKYLIDRDGIIVEKYAGPVAQDALERDIRALLKEKT